MAIKSLKKRHLFLSLSVLLSLLLGTSSVCFAKDVLAIPALFIKVESPMGILVWVNDAKGYETRVYIHFKSTSVRPGLRKDEEAEAMKCIEMQLKQRGKLLLVEVNPLYTKTRLSFPPTIKADVRHLFPMSGSCAQYWKKEAKPKNDF